MPGILIKNGTVVNDDAKFVADVLIQDGIIVDVRPNISAQDYPNVRVLDATDRLVIPGGIDPHTHLQLPFMGDVSCDDFYSGTRAALAGGTTMIIDFVIGDKSSSLIDSWKKWRSWADPKVCCDYGLSVAVTAWSPEIAEQMKALTGPEYGVNAFKFFLAYKGSFMIDDSSFLEALQHCSKIGALARVHAENGSAIDNKQKELLEQGVTGPEGHTQSRPEELEGEATNRACVLAEQANCPLYVVHVMTKPAAEAIERHLEKGNVVFGEPIAAGLALDGSGYYDEDWDKAAGLVMSPPLSREEDTPQALMDRLAKGLLHLTGTDNCTFTCAQKRRGKTDFTKIPNGVNGLEDRMSVVWEKGVHAKKIDEQRFVAITSTMAAKIFGCYPRKGRIAPGSDADIVIWNPNCSRVISVDTHHQAVDYNIFEGMTVHGTPETTICGGKVVYEKGTLNVEGGSGRYVPFAPFNDFVYAPLASRGNLFAPKKVERLQ
uniref:dihydropyrimidinase n=1 Tax=Steinernema glaseri TaxID=37863 RepID=A0A1I7Z9C1_9BILA